jgi:hypothetical protein
MPYVMRLRGEYATRVTPPIPAGHVGSRTATGADEPMTPRDVPGSARIGAA